MRRLWAAIIGLSVAAVVALAGCGAGYYDGYYSSGYGYGYSRDYDYYAYPYGYAYPHREYRRGYVQPRVRAYPGDPYAYGRRYHGRYGYYPY